jgi:protein-L-isoaspartate(D-aspartate) O-methyltransferase
VFKASESLDKNLRVLEVGTGQGDITSIFCYLGFKDIISFRTRRRECHIANEKLKHLFSVDSVVRHESFPCSGQFNSDILVLVNCVYAEEIHSKEEYKEQIIKIYSSAGCPRIFCSKSSTQNMSYLTKYFPTK